MNLDVSFVRSYIVPTSSSGHHHPHHVSLSNSNGNYQKLLQRRQDLCNSARKRPEITATFEQTITFIEQLKRNQHKSVTDINRLPIQIPPENNNDKKTLTPQELTYQLNLKLEYLIRTRVIERHRVITRTNILPRTPSKSRTTPRENYNRTTLSDISQSSQKLVVSLSTTTTNTTILQDDLADKESFEENDEVFEELIEEENINFLQQQQTLDKDPFEVEDEEYEAELEEESVRSSESDVEADSAFPLDPALLLSDKTRRVGNTEVKPGLIPSLFINVPPTIRFCTENQRIEPLPLPLRKMMKWKMSTITPNVVKNTITRSGFRLINSDEGNDWLGTWSRHMKPICFKAIREYQKVNHFPGSFQIGRKDRLWRNLSHMQAVHSRREFDFVPQTFVLPADLLLFKRVFEEITDTKESKWIIKPPASARGQGIRVISKMEHVPKKRPVIVQKYIANPYLINGHKFDLRLYVYVTSHDPLRIYLFDDGLARFASRKYSPATKSLSDRFMHLTNYSINRYNSEYRTNNDSGACTGHKWSLKALWTYLKKRDVDVTDVMEKIKDLIIKTIISADAYINVLTKANVRRKFSVHELFGFDVILDEQCKPYIVEVNISPSLHSNSPLDISIKGAMISDLLNLSGFMIPDRRDTLYEGSARRKPKLPKSLIFDRRALPQALSTDEKLKHQYFAQRYHDEHARRNILDVLTPDDIRILIETEDEYARRGSFERIFPTNQTRKYLKYFETPRYYNLLVHEWITKYNRMEERGIAHLNTFCKKGIHVQHPAIDPTHMWTQYQKLQGHLSHRENDNTNTNGS
ncbi:unnamed protein product [Rotaria sordida]|uniref:Tubulin polyglutamylase TTLL4 n=1 Tax=Rotaria sordida TaxID=392033 RepID=A0A814R9Z7_9BILA|nr:unnamed protein product [Rotaria sordida]CAF1129282.1 unnamed protein product [Rotaria sordida]CAF1196801.1 unnamed protein product [Rotaria sordida]CAF3490612.1 unnamed protein product [Rotaria sordida]CAF3545526.1 unnamed protein product [Rotaria sordida]